MRFAPMILWTVLALMAGMAPSHADKRVALVIGNGAYAHVGHLPNPSHDAEDVAAALKRIGFETIVGVDLDRSAMESATIRFARAARGADVAVFYYSGHAIQFAGVNYLLPIDAELNDDTDLRRMARVDEVLADLQRAGNLRILVLDSCRDNPLAEQLKRSIGASRSASIGRGLARMESPDGTIISYSTQAGRTAADGGGRNSPYTTAFLKHIEGKAEIGTVFRRISSDVYETTGRTQVPELSLSFFGEFYLNGKLQPGALPVEPVITARPDPAQPAIDPAAQAWAATKDTTSVAYLEAFIRRFGDSYYADLARVRIDELSKSQSAAVVTPARPATPPPVVQPVVIAPLKQAVEPRPPVRPMIGAVGGTPLALVREIRSSSWLNLVSFSPDGQSVLVGERDGSSIFDTTSGTLVRKFKDGKVAGEGRSIFSPDGRFVVQSRFAVAGDAGLVIWDAASGALVRSIAARRIYNFVFLPNGNYIVACSDGFAALWDVSSGALVREYNEDKASAWTAAVSPDGKLLLTVGGSGSESARLLNLSTGAFIKEFKDEGRISAIAFSPDGRKFLSGGDDKIVRLRDVASGTVIREFKGPSVRVENVAISPDGGLILAVSGGKPKMVDISKKSAPVPGQLHLWDAVTGTLIKTVEVDSGSVNSVVFSPDGRLIASAGVRGVRLWNVGSVEQDKGAATTAR